MASPPTKKSSFDDVEQSEITELPDLTSSGKPAPPAPEDEEMEEAEEVPNEKEPESPSRPVLSNTQTRVASVEDGETVDPEKEEQEATRIGGRIVLEVEAGPDEGKSKRFNRVRMVLGRAEGCEFRLTDPSVSRRHAELVQGESGVLCRDLASGNGTKVNGENVTEQLLNDGDKISIGATVIAFIDEARTLERLREDARKREEADAQAAEAAKAQAAREQEEAERVKAKEEEERRIAQMKVPWSPVQKLVVGVAGGLAALLIILLLATVGDSGPDREDLARERMESAQVAFKMERFERAIALIEEAEKLFPGIDSQKLLPRARTEWAAQTAVATAQKAMANNQFDEAREALKAFPREASEARRKERDAFIAALSAAEVGFWKTEAERLLRAGDLEGGRAYYLRLPPHLQEPLKALLDTVEEEAIARERQEAAREAELKAKRQQKVAAERQAQIDEALSNVARKFHGGDYTRAANECERVAISFRDDAGIRERARQLQTWIPLFGRYFEEGARKFRGSQWSSAIAPLRKARELYLKIGFPGAIGQQIDEQLASAYLASARDSMARGEWLEASRQLKEGRRFDGQDPRFKEGLRRLEIKAQELYHEGYLNKERDLDKALALFRMVLQLSPPGTEPYEKARRQIAALKQ